LKKFLTYFDIPLNSEHLSYWAPFYT